METKDSEVPSSSSSSSNRPTNLLTTSNTNSNLPNQTTSTSILATTTTPTSLFHSSPAQGINTISSNNATNQQTTNALPKNVKNLSIKEFFTSRLMKAKSLESGNQSPKDETTNWFDEFKARMIKKSQKSESNNYQILEESNQSEESNDSGENVAARKEQKKSKIKSKSRAAALASAKSNIKMKNMSPFSKVNHSCDNDPNLSVLTESFEDITDQNHLKVSGGISIYPSTSTSVGSSSGGGLFGLRARRVYKISCVDKPDFDTASINTIFDRRDSRYDKIVTDHYHQYSRTSSLISYLNRIANKIQLYLKWSIANLLPFNYNLPWKLLSAVLFALVIIVIGFATNVNPEIRIFSFLNGFVCGIAIATLCFVIVFISLVIRILPDSERKSTHRMINPSSNWTDCQVNPISSPVSTIIKNNNNESHNASSLTTRKNDSSRLSHEMNQTNQISGISVRDSRSYNQRVMSRLFDSTQNCPTTETEKLSPKQQEKTDETTPKSELLSPLSPSSRRPSTDPMGLVDENYKSWMIEFIGDYELRKKAEVKLKLLYVKFENRVLHLYKVKSNQDIESSSFPSNTQQRIYDLKKVKKFSANLLFPKNVRNLKKWLWSKKYPIRLEFIQAFNINNSQHNSTTSNNDINAIQIDSPIKSSASASDCKTIQLTLFTKTCREKEEWFRRFKRIVEEVRLTQVGLGPDRFLLSGSINNPSSTNSRQSQVNNSLDITEPPQSNRSSKRKLKSGPQAQDNENLNYSPTGVQASSSSTILAYELRNLSETSVDYDTINVTATSTSSSPGSGLSRTKSCELIHEDDPSRSESPSSWDSQAGDVSLRNVLDHSNNSSCNTNASGKTPKVLHDDNTLTPANVEIFSQAIGDLDFMESRPSLNYQEYIERVIESSAEATNTSDWFNSFTGRIFFDVFSQNYWSHWFKRKIDSKLHRIRLPYFMDTLTLTNIDLGSNAPQFLNVVSHQFDSFGLSIDFDVSYAGGLTMTFETKLNLLKMKPDSSTSSSQSQTNAANATNSTTTSNNNNPSEQSSSLNNNNSKPDSSSTTNINNNDNNSKSGPESKGNNNNSTMNNEHPARHRTTSSNQVNEAGGTCTNNKDSSIDCTDNVDQNSNNNNLSTGGPNNSTNTNHHNNSEHQQSQQASPGASSSSTSSIGTSSLKGSDEGEGSAGVTTSDSSDSDTDSSSESSSDEADIDEISDWEDYGAEKTRQNLVRLVDKIASSRYFQSAAENRYIKKKLLDISNCPLVLVVKIVSLNGVLTFNIPPPQTDRVWYGFKPNPELVLKALPRMGDRQVSLSHVTDWIERKLEEEFRKILVIPNMEDIVLPVLKSDHLLYVTPTK